jgi:hypothetical protein
MKNLEKYDSVSERLPENATPAQRLEKFFNITAELNKHNIFLLEIKNGCPVVTDNSGWKLTHNIVTWEIFRVEDVVDMILSNRKNNVAMSNH